jgi:signal transduction histidine kinase
MSRPPSLRGRLLTGATLWTLGFFTIVTFIFVTTLESGAPFVRMVHTVFGHTPLIGVLAIVLMWLGVRQVARGVSPLAHLRTRLAAVHQGQSRRLEGDFPAEVAPLVDDLNTLLSQHETTVARAQAKAGDLAHGLKTPLAVLAREADQAAEAGHHDLADAIRQQVDRMQGHISYHLAHARAAASAASATARCPVADSVAGLTRTMQRLHAERGLTIDVTVSDALIVRVERQDLDEMLGNLIDNACKWATSRVHVSAKQAGDAVVVMIDDDGPGVPADRRTDVLRRGVRADQTAPGSGFGLAIVADLAEIYGGSIHLTDSPLGGSRAVLSVPAASPEAGR